MSNFSVTYYDLITHANNLGIKFIPWDRCKRGSSLGGGASMNVFDGTYEDDDIIQKAAFKSVKTSLTEKTKESKRSIVLRDIRQEIRIMGSLKGHSRVVQLLAVSFNDHTPILILELAKSNLEDYLQNEEVEWKTKLGFMYDIALGVEAVHKIEVVHGDLKASNILIYDSDHGQMIAKISDFGFSSTNFSVQAGRTPGYTPNFRSPESFDPELSDWNGKNTIDIYSYGLVVYQIANNGKIPFDDYGEDEIDIMKKEGSALEVLMEDLPDDTPAEVRKVIMATVKRMPSERLSLNEVKNILKECTEWNQVYSYEEAKLAFESLAEDGPQESITIGEMDELPIPSSLKTSIFREYQRLAGTGDMTAMYKLAVCWDYGFGTEKDSSKAAECYETSAGAGIIKAQTNLGVYYQRVTKDYVKAAELYTKAAEAGDVTAQYNLAVCYKNGLGVTQDYTKAVELYTKAAEAGNTNALNNLALCYENGQGVTQDYVKAVEMYKKAAKTGNIGGQFNFDFTYMKAVQWYSIAAEDGDTTAYEKIEKLREIYEED